MMITLILNNTYSNYNYYNSIIGAAGRDAGAARPRGAVADDAGPRKGTRYYT